MNVHGGYADIIGANILNSNLYFDANLTFPSSLNLSQDVLTKIILCSIEGDDRICQGIYFDVNCNSTTQESIGSIINDFGNHSKEEISVYPNPASGIVRVELSKDKVFEKMEVYSIDGQRVHIQRLNTRSKRFEFDSSEFNYGVHILVFKSKFGDVEFKKLLVTK